MGYENRMERSSGAFDLTPRPGCGVPLEDGSGTILRTGDRLAADNPIARKYRHRLMVFSSAPDPVQPNPVRLPPAEGVEEVDDEEGGDG